MTGNKGTIRRSALIGLLVVAAQMGGCGAEDRRRDVASDGDGNVGAVGFALQLAPGLTLDTARYTIAGPAGFTKSGAIDVSHSGTLSAVISALPAGAGFTIDISATTADGMTACTGAATFAIAARLTTSVVVHLTCREAPRTGSISVTGSIDVCPVLDGISASPSEVTVGASLALAALAHDLDAGPSALAYHWVATSGVFDAPSSASPSFTCLQPGTVTLTVSISDGDPAPACADSGSITIACTGVPRIVINEVESSGGVPGDWVELYNAGTAAADVSGWRFLDGDNAHVPYLIPAGTTVAAGAYLVLEESQFVFGLGASDSARLFDAVGAPVDSYSWTAHAATTYGRCPSGTGPFVTSGSATKGGTNDCGPVAPPPPPPPPLPAWPGANAVATVDETTVFGGNLSDLFYEPATASAPAVLWAVRNGPSTLYRLIFDGATWTPEAANGWDAGKTLLYPGGGTGAPDSEGVTRAELTSPAIYVATERDNDNNGISRLSILRYDTGQAGAALVATHEWNLNGDLPVVGPNLGLEAITWIPDSYLVATSFFDEAAGQAYDPSRYPAHGTGLFFVGLEANGAIYGYALDHVAGTFRRVATIASGNASVMSTYFDRDVGYLWTYCDDTCGNVAGVLGIDTVPTSPTLGRFTLLRQLARPSTMPNINNEGIAIAPEAECVSGFKPFFWTDDSETDGHSIRRDTIPCGRFIP